jgi:hypothetical protein
VAEIFTLAMADRLSDHCIDENPTSVTRGYTRFSFGKERADDRSSGGVAVIGPIWAVSQRDRRGLPLRPLPTGRLEGVRSETRLLLTIPMPARSLEGEYILLNLGGIYSTS